MIIKEQGWECEARLEKDTKLVEDYLSTLTLVKRKQADKYLIPFLSFVAKKYNYTLSEPITKVRLIE